MLKKWLLCWRDHGLGANKSKLQAKYGLSARVGLRMIGNPRLTHDTNDRCRYGLSDSDAVETMLVTNIGMSQKQSAVRMNLDETTSSFGPTGWDRKSAPDCTNLCAKIKKTYTSRDILKMMLFWIQSTKQPQNDPKCTLLKQRLNRLGSFFEFA